MIIGVDEQYRVISIGKKTGNKVFAYKIIDKSQELDLDIYNYKYVNGRIINDGMKPEAMPKTQLQLIDEELALIDSQGVTRHLENQIEASGTYDTIYESTRKLIDRKNELREERKSLLGGNTNAEDNSN
jgi:uncharacterized protein YdcH (DUF465 family)